MKNIPNHCSDVHREQTNKHKIKDQEGQQLNRKLLKCEKIIETTVISLTSFILLLMY